MGIAAILVIWLNSFVIPILPNAFIWNLVSNDLTVYEKNMFLFSNLSDTCQGLRKILTFDTH